MSSELRAVRAWYVLAGVLALGAAACAGILGIEDRQLEPSDGGTVQPEGGNQDAPGNGDAPTSDSPPGETGPGPDAGAGCDGPCVLATSLNHPFAVTSDSNNVYWTELGDDFGSTNGSVKSCPVSGCGAGPKVIATAQANPEAIVVDANAIYFSTGGSTTLNAGIFSCPLSGCTGTPTHIVDVGTVYGMTVDATSIYWADNSDSTIHRIAKSAGSDTVLYDAGDMQISQPGDIAVDTSFAYVTDVTGAVFREPIGGGSPVRMAMPMTSGYWPVQLDALKVYYGAGGGIIAMSKNAGNGGPFIATQISAPQAIVLDPATSRIYWADLGSGSGNDGTVGRVGVDGGGQQVLASSLVVPYGVTVSGPYVLWISYGTVGDAGNTDPNTGQLLSLPK
jgi:hypothetical protein